MREPVRHLYLAKAILFAFVSEFRKLITAASVGRKERRPLSKIAPDLLEVLERRDQTNAGALARGDRATMALEDAPIQVFVTFDGPPDSLMRSGVPIGSLVSDSACGGLSPAHIRKLATLPQVHRISLPAKSQVRLNRSVPEILADQAWSIAIGAGEEARGKGDGVIIGIIDSGIDVFHGAFRNADGSSRILRLWDQTFDYAPADPGVPVDDQGDPITGDLQPTDETGAVLTRALGRAPTDLRVSSDAGNDHLFTYGAQFSTSQINGALAAHPDGKDLPVSLRDDPVGGPDGTAIYHGTHVAGIAAGNGAQKDQCTSAFTYVGVAPNAQLVIVKTGVGSTPNRISNVVEAVQYIFRVAARENNRPCVVNVSIDNHTAPHNGKSFQSRSFDTLVTAPLGVGRAIVVAAGNERNLNLHAAVAIAKGTTQTLYIRLLVKGARQITLFASHNPGATITCFVRAPGPGPTQQTNLLRTNASNTISEPVGTLSHRAVGSLFTTTASDPDKHFTIDVTDAKELPVGTWEVDIDVDGASEDANLHLWVGNPQGYDISILPLEDAVASPQDAGRDDPKMRRPEDWIAATIGSKASTRSVITVAAYTAEATPTALQEASSQGPAPNNLALGLYARGPQGAYAKPDIAAPGVNIDAPRGEARKGCLECECCVDRYVEDTGTSMAAPHIAGVVALMLARDPSLTPDAIKTLLRNTRRDPPAPPPNWPPLGDLWGGGKVDAKAAVQAAVVPRAMAPEEEVAPASIRDLRPRILPVAWPERLRAWGDLLDPHPSWNLCAALVSQHFDEVKRLIDTNRRVAAVWQRHGGPALVRDIVFAAHPPDRPVPAAFANSESRTLVARFLQMLLRFGGDELRADIVRHASLMQALPGASWDELDAMIGGRT